MAEITASILWVYSEAGGLTSSVHQSMSPSLPYRASSQSFAALKCPLPKKPRDALSGDGCYVGDNVVRKHRDINQMRCSISWIQYTCKYTCTGVTKYVYCLLATDDIGGSRTRRGHLPRFSRSSVYSTDQIKKMNRSQEKRNNNRYKIT